VRLPARRGTDIEIEDRSGDVDGGARVRDVHDSGKPSLDWSGPQDHVRLDVRIAEFHEVVDGMVAGASVRQLRVQITFSRTETHERMFYFWETPLVTVQVAFLLDSARMLTKSREKGVVQNVPFYSSRY
jgi:hypothetical protein